MPFWSGEKLRNNLSQIIDKPNQKDIDCAAYTLHVGPEIYITPHSENKDPQTNAKKYLDQKEAFTIPPGQFAYLLTEEIISIPNKCLGFISIKATIKFKGLVNVSGFHVDPGWRGRLIFSAYNAGPAPLHLERGEAVFLLWIADLDNAAKDSDAKNGTRSESIPSNLATIPSSLIANIPGQIHSLQSLSGRIDNLDKKLDLFLTRWAIYGALIIGIVTFLFRGPIISEFNQLMNFIDPETTVNQTLQMRKERNYVARI